MILHRFAAHLTVGLVALSLAGCVASEPKPTPTGAATPAPTPTSDPVAAGPTPRIDATCGDLLDASALQAFVGVSGQPLSAVTAADRLTPDAAAVEQLGALTCRWTNGLEGDPFTAPELSIQEIELSILPEGLDAAIEYVDLYQIADPTYGEHVQGPRCVDPVGSATFGNCELFGVIGQTWIEFHVSGIVAAEGPGEDELVAGFRGIVDPMVAAVAAMTPRERWVPETSSMIGDSECDALAPTDEIIGITAIPNLRVGLQWDGPHVGQYWYGTQQVGAMRCSLGLSDSDAAVGQIGILPSGIWGFDRYRDAWIDAGGTPVELTGVEAGHAIARCADPARACLLDFTVAGDWVRVLVYPAPSSGSDGGPPAGYFVSARAAVSEIASLVAGRIASH
ncbi:hypothetical protein J7E25_03460 [Agromyces sp. ISL-38]|uniref:hypothetical protein n=1 Tax=Agromyces sp. ISL-38 TaxID=2819107 RepID=UPI001BEC883E|nr:hypothetical protein [Agromyces sp. ISL-38]MBT2498143.1 hypothetical protein [Agromyces sp. ISL-38]